MLPLSQISPEQIQSYRPIWGEFTCFGYQFPGSHSRTHLRNFAFYGSLDVCEEGLIALRELLVACSCEDTSGEQAEAVRMLEGRLEGGQWHTVRKEPCRVEYAWEPFYITLFTQASRDGRDASHLLLSYGCTDQHRVGYLQHCLPEEGISRSQPSAPLSHFYPVGTDYAAECAESLTVAELARRLRGQPVVAFTGAGISLSSGIPTFTGPGGLERDFPLWEPFPGVVAHRMVDRPHELARRLGQFQASFVTAQPNAAHFALAELEKQGRLVCVLTGNGDRLHERAGSQRVHLKDPRFFANAGEGWIWIREGKVFLVVGVSRDEHGLLSYARDQGLRIVVIAPERPPFLYAQDWFVQGRAEEMLPELATRREGWMGPQLPGLVRTGKRALGRGRTPRSASADSRLREGCSGYPDNQQTSPRP
jgi:NAD-dependent SIR2 family protein deacetylase